MLNSLRLHGHDETVYVLDRGLTEAQRESLRAHVQLVQPRDDVHPILSKTYAPLTAPADVMVLLDVDVIITQPLTALLDKGEAGHVVAFADEIDERFVPEWETILELPPLRRRAYINSGFLVLPRALSLSLLDRLRDVQQRVELGASRFGGGTTDDPFFFPDQDVWNALLSSLVADDDVEILQNRLAPFPPFRGIELDDITRVRCRYADGTRPYLLHYISRKPWLAPTSRSVFTKLFTRLLLADDVPVRVSPEDVPLRLRGGSLGSAAALAAEAPAWVARNRGRLGLRRRLRSRSNATP